MLSLSNVVDAVAQTLFPFLFNIKLIPKERKFDLKQIKYVVDVLFPNIRFYRLSLLLLRINSAILVTDQSFSPPSPAGASVLQPVGTSGHTFWSCRQSWQPSLPWSGRVSQLWSFGFMYTDLNDQSIMLTNVSFCSVCLSGYNSIS